MSGAVDRALWPREELAAELARRRAERPGLRVVLANGCFDLLHAGHVSYLSDARSRGDLLVVALNTDASVRELKGPGRPLLPLAERAAVVGALRPVDLVTSFDERDLESTLRLLRPDVHAKGSDYTAEGVPEAAVDRELAIEVAICGEAKTSSSSELLARARAGRGGPAGWVCALWAVAAFLSALSGIGGGLFAVPVLHYLGGLDMKRAVGTSLLLVLVLTTTGTVVELSRADSALDGAIVGLLIVGGFFGARAGFAVSRRVSTVWLKRVFAVLLVFSAVRILGLDRHIAAGAGPGLESLGTRHAVIVALIGIGGGFVSPLLGVGGGLVVIPALLLSLPELSYLQARACSTAFAVFTSSQSALMHLRAGNVERKVALRFALLTVLGAITGVMAVHQRGWASAARVVMGLILLFVAGRFAWDALRPARGKA